MCLQPLRAQLQHPIRDVSRRRRILLQAQRMQHLVNDRRLGLARISTRGAFEVTAAQIDRAAAGFREREHPVPPADRTAIAVEEVDQLQVALRCRAELLEALRKRPSTPILELRKQGLARRPGQPLEGSRQRVPRGVARVGILDQYAGPVDAGELTARREPPRSKAAHRSHHAPPDHATETGGRRPEKLEIAPEKRLKNREFFLQRYNRRLRCDIRMQEDFHLGKWLVQPKLCRLTADGRTVQVRAKVMDLLACLARYPGEVVAKDRLLDEVWKSHAISESALTRTVTELRQALEDDADQPRMLETIPKRGYRLIAPVTPVQAPSPRPNLLSERPRESVFQRIFAIATAVIVILVTVAFRVADSALRRW